MANITHKVYEDITSERIRAHYKHSPTGCSMEDVSAVHQLRLPVLVEEVGEVARAMQDNPKNLRTELIQVAAMTCAWIDAIDRASQEG